MLIRTHSKEKLTKEEAFKKIKETVIKEIENGLRDEYFDVILEDEIDGHYYYMTNFNTGDIGKYLYCYERVDWSKEKPPKNGKLKTIDNYNTLGKIKVLYIYTRKIYEPARYGFKEIDREAYLKEWRSDNK